MATVVTRTLKARYLQNSYAATYIQNSYSVKLTNVYFTIEAGIPYAIPHFIGGGGEYLPTGIGSMKVGSTFIIT